MIALAMGQQLPDRDNVTRITNGNTLNRFTRRRHQYGTRSLDADRRHECAGQR